MQKNDELILKIEDMGVDGAGIGKSDGMTFFVKDAVIGDVVRAKIIKLKKTYGYARLMELLEASADRVEPNCPYYRQCGGCQIQALSYEKQLEFKENKVRNNLERIGGFTKIRWNRSLVWMSRIIIETKHNFRWERIKKVILLPAFMQEERIRSFQIATVRSGFR